MDLRETAKEINEILENRRKEIELTYIESKHTYFMKDDTGKKRANFPSVSKLIKNFFAEFDQEKKALEMTNGDMVAARKLILEWKKLGEISTNMGSRVHYLLEQDLVGRYDNYKEVRQPIFKCDESMIAKSDQMIIAGKKYLDLMHERGAILLDTEIVLGDPELGYVGQPDKAWIMENKQKNGIGLVITDWKSNQPKNFELKYYNEYLYEPFKNHRDYALSHYWLQLPLYGKLLLKMLKESKYEDLKLLGGVVVLLKDDATYVEYKVPKDIIDTILTMDITKYTKK